MPDDWPTVASIDPSSSAACIAALRSWGFYAYTQACVGNVSIPYPGIKTLPPVNQYWHIKYIFH